MGWPDDEHSQRKFAERLAVSAIIFNPRSIPTASSGVGVAASSTSTATLRYHSPSAFWLKELWRSLACNRFGSNTRIDLPQKRIALPIYRRPHEPLPRSQSPADGFYALRYLYGGVFGSCLIRRYVERWPVSAAIATLLAVRVRIQFRNPGQLNGAAPGRMLWIAGVTHAGCQQLRTTK